MAGNAVIGALRVNLGIDTAQFTEGLGKAQSSLARFGKTVAVAAAAAGAAIAGALAAGVQMRLPARRSFWHDAAAALALVIAGTRIAISPGGSWEGYGWLGIPYAFPVFPLAIAAALVCLAHSRLLAVLLDNAPVRYVARISFGIYVWQEIVLLTMKELDPESFGATETDVLAGWISSCGIATALVVMIASLSYYLLEKPVLRSSARPASINNR